VGSRHARPLRWGGSKKMTRFDPAHLDTVLWEINEGPDRSVAIVWSSLLEDALRTAMTRAMNQDLTKKALEDIFENYPLVTFSARISLAYAFKIINKVQRDDLNVIRGIRNEFAHNFAISSFGDKNISSRCMSLQAGGFRWKEGLDPKDPRYRFTFTSMILWAHLGRHVGAMSIDPVRGVREHDLERGTAKSLKEPTTGSTD
jgi:hypothetical protein